MINEMTNAQANAPDKKGVELLPCPFCGGDAERFDVQEEDDANRGSSCIQCKQCVASTALHFDRKENLVSSWNARAALATCPAEMREPAAWVSPGQLAEHVDPPENGDEGGKYLPVRKTKAGNFVQPLYASPPPDTRDATIADLSGQLAEIRAAAEPFAQLGWNETDLERRNDPGTTRDILRLRNALAQHAPMPMRVS